MTGLEYEHVVAKYLQKIGYSNVDVTPGSGDYGVDVLAYKDGHKYAVQCKYYSTPLGQDPIREAVAGMAMYGCDKAMVVTNTTFTDAARRLAAANDVVLLSNIDEKCAPTNANFSDTALGCLGLMIIVFIAGGLLYGAYDISKGASLSTTLWTWGCMIVFVTSPFWIWFLIRQLWRLLCKGVRKLFTPRRPIQPMSTPLQSPQPAKKAQSSADPTQDSLEKIYKLLQTNAKANPAPDIAPSVVTPKEFEAYLKNQENELDAEYALNVAVFRKKPELQKLVQMLNDLKHTQPQVYYRLYDAVKAALANDNIANHHVIHKALGKTRELAVQVVSALQEMRLVVSCDELPLEFVSYSPGDYYLLVSEQEFIDIIGIAESEDAEAQEKTV